MGLIIYKSANGTMRPTWWGRLIYKGKAHEKNLQVRIAGTPPVDEEGNIALSSKGDEAFERSRKAADKALDAWRKETRTNPAELQESAYKAHTGVSIAGVPLAKLADKWIHLKRQRKPTAERTRNARITFKRFSDFARAFAAKSGKSCDTLNDITPRMVEKWFEAIKGEYAWGTVKDMMHLMSGAFRRWSTNGRPNPFADIVMRSSKEVGEEKKRTERKALTPEQFQRLLACSRDNERLYPLIVCAAYTGMRIGDVCSLKVSDVDFKTDTIDCVTSKAGVRVNIPILSPEFRNVLVRGCAVPGDGSERSPYVFPWAAAQYAKNRTAIVRSVKPYFARAIFGDSAPVEEAKPVGEESHPVDLATAAAEAGFSETKRKRVLEVYRQFKAGIPSHTIAEALQIARGQVSAYLKDAERLTGETLRPRAARNGKLGFTDLLEKTRLERKIGKYAASIWGWHNLRHNFITSALNAGVPLHKVSAIVGHSSTAMTTGYADLTTRTAPVAALPEKSASNNAMLQAMAAMLAALSPEQKRTMSAMLADKAK